MSYRIARGERVVEACRRIMREELAGTLVELQDGRNDSFAVHEMRKALKRWRALLRVIRPALPSHFFEEQNRTFREAGQAISSARDVYVQQQLLKRMDDLPRGLHRRVQEKLEEEAMAGKKSERVVRVCFVKLLWRTKSEIMRWPWGCLTYRELAAGMRRVWKKGRTAFRMARDDPSPENLHEWRKRTKDLWHGFQLIEEFCSKAMRKRMRQIKSLSQCLGIDHDLFVLEKTLQDLPSSRKGFRQAAKMIRNRQMELRKRAFRLGGKIYGQKLACFEKRLWRLLSQ